MGRPHRARAARPSSRPRRTRKLSFRLVAHQEPGRCRRRRCGSTWREHTPPGIEARVTLDGPGVAPVLSPVDSPAVPRPRGPWRGRSASEVLFTREGGSGPEADLADDPGRAAGVPGGRPGLGPDPRPEREGGDGAAAQGRRGGCVPVGRLGRGRRPSSRRHGERRRPAASQRPVSELGNLALARAGVDRATARRGTTSLARGGLGGSRTPACSWSTAARPCLRLGRGDAAELVLLPARGRRRTGSGSCSGIDADGIVYFGVAAPPPRAGAGDRRRPGPARPACARRGRCCPTATPG